MQLSHTATLSSRAAARTFGGLHTAQSLIPLYTLLPSEASVNPLVSLHAIHGGVPAASAAGLLKYPGAQFWHFPAVPDGSDGRVSAQISLPGVPPIA